MQVAVAEMAEEQMSLIRETRRQRFPHRCDEAVHRNHRQAHVERRMRCQAAQQFADRFPIRP